MRDWRTYVRAQLPALHVPPERESEIVAELSDQLAQAYDDAIASGATEAQALARARASLGDWNRLARGIEGEERRPGFFTGARGDVRYALRFLARNPVFTAVAVLTLAFGIGGNTAVFTLADALVLRGVPYPRPERLLAIETRKTQQPEIEPWTSALDFFDFRDRARSYSALTAVSAVWSVALTGRGPAETLNALYCSAELFPMTGVRFALGRGFAPEEDRRTQPSNVVIVSHSFWQRRLGGSRDAIGQRLNLDSRVFDVIGVLPADFRWAGEPVAGSATLVDVWFPLASNTIVTTVRNVRFLKVAGRLRDGVSIAQARDEAKRLGAALSSEFPATNRGFDWDAAPFQQLVTGRLRTTVMLLVGAVGFVLLMACANVANLLLARAAARDREISVRVAMGASRPRLVRQLLTEGLLLAALGGLAAIPLAIAALRFVTVAGPETLVQGFALQLDTRALAFTSVAVLITALLAGLPPAIRLTGGDIASGLREGGRGLVAGHHRLRAILMAGQVAVALVLLVGAGLLIHSFRNLLDVRPGIDAANVIAIPTQIPAWARTPQQRATVYEQIRAKLSSAPGVTGVAAVSRLPFAGRNLGSFVFVEGRSVPGEPGFDTEYRVCTPEYFAVMGIPLRAGRLFDAHDDAAPSAVVVINQSMASKYWPAADPIGKRIKLGSNPEAAPWITVIGVVGDVRHFGLESDPRPELYRPYALNPLGAPILVVRARANAPAMVADLSARVRSVDSAMPTYGETAMGPLVERSTAQRRFVMLLITSFALAALLVAGVGIYGLVAQAVAQRTSEIGLRMALGASPAAVLAMVFRQGARLMGAGMAIGSAGAAGLAWLMRGMLFGIGPLDPVAFMAAAATLAAFTLAACYVPARRATKVDPIAALRQ
jgi:putative ABC transport system permease protein